MQDEAHCHHRQRDTEQRGQVLDNTGNKEHAEEEEDVQLHDSQRLQRESIEHSYAKLDQPRTA